MKRLLIVWLTVCFSSLAFSASQQELDEFYADQENELFYMESKSKGHIDKNRVELIAACHKIAAGKETSNCGCYEEELPKVSDEELFFDNLTSLRYQLAINNAKKEGDEKLAQELYEKRIARNTVLVKLAKICGPM